MNNFQVIKNYKNLENHWISGQKLNFKSNTIDKSIPVIFTKKNNSLNYLFNSNVSVLKKQFYLNNYVNYNVNLNKLEFKDNIKFWYTNNNNYYFNKILWQVKLQTTDKKFKKICKNLKSIFQRLENPNFEKNLIKTQLILNNKILEKRLYNLNYGYTLPKQLIKKFIKKCLFNYLIWAKENNQPINCVLVGANWGGLLFQLKGSIFFKNLTFFMPYSLAKLKLSPKFKKLNKNFEFFINPNKYIAIRVNVNSFTSRMDYKTDIPKEIKSVILKN